MLLILIYIYENILIYYIYNCFTSYHYSTYILFKIGHLFSGQLRTTYLNKTVYQYYLSLNITKKQNITISQLKVRT